MEDYKQIYQEWMQNEYFDEEFRNELKNLPEDEIKERFFMDLEFGTAGLRGIIGAGRNRMNKYIIRRATQGYANYLLSKEKNASCVIAHDMRRCADLFTKEAACVLAGNGIKTYLFKDMRSTPELSFTVRYLLTTGGIVLTASHNPKEYNGFKVYDKTGGQLVPHEADMVTREVESIKDFNTIKYMNFDEAMAAGKIVYLEDVIDDAYLATIMKQIRHEEAYSIPLNTVYTPMHGVGAQIMPKLFDKLFLKDVFPVPSQMIPDSDFPTVKYPNPEENGAFEVAMKYAEEVNGELIIGTDPDADRMAIVVKGKDGKFHQLNGNEIGSLFTYYVLSETNPMPKDPRIVKTIVTGDMPLAIARKYGVKYEETLTGFKFIGEKINKYEALGESFLLGYEEAIGFLIGTHARDKDGVVATMLAIEMAKFYKNKGKNLLEVLEDIYKEFGYYKAETISKVYKGIEGMEIISKLMTSFRDKFEAYYDVADDKMTKVEDYKTLKTKDLSTGTESDIDMVKSNVLKYFFKNNDWICVRPSGTEPKIKFYYCVSGETEEKSLARLKELQDCVEEFTKKCLE